MKKKHLIIFISITACFLVLSCSNDFQSKSDFQSNVEMTNKEFLLNVESRISPLLHIISPRNYIIWMQIDTINTQKDFEISLYPYEKDMLSVYDTTYFGISKIKGFYCLMYGVYSPELMVITKKKTVSKVFPVNGPLLYEYDPLCNTFLYSNDSVQ